MKRVVNIYIRENGIYVIPRGITNQGFPYGTEPFEYLPGNPEVPVVWEAVLKCLANTNRVVPHPETWDQVLPWYIHAGVERWHDFASNAKAMSIEDAGEKLKFSALRWDGRGFAGVADLRQSIDTNAGNEEKMAVFGETLRKAMEIECRVESEGEGQS